MTRRGILTVVRGPMFAGKTSTLLREACGRADALIVKPAIDRRYDGAAVVSHDGARLPALAVSSWPAERAATAGIVLVDEVQFFEPPHYEGDLVAEIGRLLADGTNAVVAGLDLDWRGEPFRVVAALEAIADRVVPLVARCAVCGGPADMTHKKVASDKVVEVGGAETYEPRCRAHWRGSLHR